MLDVQNPEIRVDEIMQRIQEKVRLRREQGAPAQAGTAQSFPPDSSIMINQLVAQARDFAQVGVSVPPMTRTRGLKRAIARVFAHVFLRIAQLITRDQRSFNNAMLAAFQAFMERVAQQQGELVRGADQFGRQMSQRVAELEAKLRNMEEQSAEERHAQALKLSQLRTTISLQERRLTLLLEEAKRRLPEALDRQQLQTFADELPHIPNASYLGFEDEFRGSREDIKRRVAVYVPKLREAGAGMQSFPILDLGCGRGELLEVLRSEGLVASGVDSNAAAVELCRALNLDVKVGDAFAVLGGISDGSLGGLSALHVVEHLPFELVVKLLDEALRVLRPGGILILETPNPKNVLVGSCNFYIDPTHRNPVHPQTLHYLVEARGMVGVETLPLHPFPKEMQVPVGDSPMARLFNELFFGPQDYAVLGRRP